MSIESTPESHLPASGEPQQPLARKRSGVRIVIYLVLACAVVFAVWRIYQNQKQAQQTAPARRRR